MKKIFLDVGGHLGQTLEEVVKPSYLFDAIYCFEPSVEHASLIVEKFQDPRLEVLPYGLSNVSGESELFSNGLHDMGASVKTGANRPQSTSTVCLLKKASEFFAEVIGEDDLVIMKLNCEGSECDIMNDLIDGNQIFKLDNVMIDFDVRKFPRLAQEEPALKKRFEEIGFDHFSLAEKVMRGRTHQNRIANWLRSLPWHEKFRPRANWSERLKGAILR